MNFYIKAVYRSFRLLIQVSSTVVVLFVMMGHAYALNTEGFVELDLEEFQDLVLGNTMVGRVSGGTSYTYFGSRGQMPGRVGGWVRLGKWEVKEKYNCIRLSFDPNENDPVRCWIALKNPVDGQHYIGVKTKKGKYRPIHKIKVLTGDQVNS